VGRLDAVARRPGRLIAKWEKHYLEAGIKEYTPIRMPKASLDELKGQIAADAYAVDSRVVAGTILTNFELIRRVRRRLMGEDEKEAPPPRTRRGSPAGRRTESIRPQHRGTD
jgi:hypothetical protein